MTLINLQIHAIFGTKDCTRSIERAWRGRIARVHTRITVSSTISDIAMARVKRRITRGRQGHSLDHFQSLSPDAIDRLRLLDQLAARIAAIREELAGGRAVVCFLGHLGNWEVLGFLMAVLGYRTDVFPGFYVRDTGLPVPWRVDKPEEVAAVARRQVHLGLRQGVVVANPVPEADEMDRALHDATLRSGLDELHRRGITGKDVTPFLLGWFHEQTAGASLAANVALVRSNARLAAERAEAENG